MAVKSLFALISVRIGEANMHRCFLFKQLTVEQGFDKLPVTHGAWIEHNYAPCSYTVYGTI